MPRRPVPVLPDTGPVRLRHIVQGTASDAGAVNVDGVYFVPQARDGVDGEQGFQDGDFERRLNEEGAMTVRLANLAGGDGKLHSERFRYFTDDDYHPGDEWLELYSRDTDLEFVGTPVAGKLTNGVVELELADALILLQTTRETAAGFWANAPRDVFEHYCRRWTVTLADSFDTPGRFTGGTTTKTTSDSVWTYVSVDEDPAHPSSARLNGDLDVGSAARPSLKSGFVLSSDGYSAWRVETTIRLGPTSTLPGEWALGVGVRDAAGLQHGIVILGNFTEGVEYAYSANYPGGSTSERIVLFSRSADSGPIRVAIEKRGRFVYYYLDGNLVGVLPAVLATTSFQVTIGQGSDAAGFYYVENVTIYRAKSLLQRGLFFSGGDLRLPGAPGQDSGLQGEYFDDADLYAGDAGTTVVPSDLVLNPTRDPYHRRIDERLSFVAGTSWWPAGPHGNDRLSVRWTGSIYLDLDSFDYALRTDTRDRMRIWVGFTRNGEEYLSDWTAAGHAGGAVTTVGNWLKAGNAGTASPSGTSGFLNGQRSGWYPIVVEFSVGAGANVAKAVLDFARSDAVGTWPHLGADPKVRVSPLGIVRSRVRFDSHYEQLAAVARDFGYQYTVEPRQLESGAFPGLCVPVIRQGRDTDKVIDELEGVEPVAASNAREVIDGLIVDAAGLATDDAAQPTYSALDASRPLAGRFALLQEYESLSDITFPRLLEQRATSLLALRRAPWEEVSVAVPGRRELRDSFPLTGQLAEFKFGVGDGARLSFPRIRVADATPRQIAGVKRPFRRGGLGAPALAFRQRPRSLRRQLRDLARTAVNPQRNPQGQYVERPGNVASNPTTAAMPDNFSRLSLPDDLDTVVKVLLIVQTRGGVATTGWTVTVNSTNVDIVVNEARTIDLTPFLARDTATVSRRRMYVGMTGGTGNVEWQAVLRLRA